MTDIIQTARLTDTRELEVTAALCQQRARELVREGDLFAAGVFHEVALIAAEVLDERRAMSRAMDKAVEESLGIKVWYEGGRR